MSESEVEESPENRALRLEVLEGQLIAATRPVELLELLASADSPQPPLAQIVRHFGVTEVQAVAMVDLQFRRAMPQLVQRLEAQIAALRENVDGEPTP